MKRLKNTISFLAILLSITLLIPELSFAQELPSVSENEIPVDIPSVPDVSSCDDISGNNNNSDISPSISENELTEIQATIEDSVSTAYSLDIHFNKDIVYLNKGKETTIKLTGDDYAGSYKSAKKVWKSSNTKVAKVSSKGLVTAVKAGESVITCSFADQVISCVVYVYDITSVSFTQNDKNKLSYTYINGTTTNNDVTFDDSDVEEYEFVVKQNNQILSAYSIYLQTSFAYPSVKSSNSKVATASITSFSGDKIKIKVKPLKPGSTTITLSFGNKKATLTYGVKQSIKQYWFELNNTEMVYTGKARKATLLKYDIPANASYKVAYSNNINVGTATLTVRGSGNYGGTVSFDYDIVPIDISDATFTSTRSRLFSGLPQAPKVSLTYKGKKLTKGKEYEVQYRADNSNKWTSDIPVNAGVYYVRAEGIGNYSGVVSDVYDYTIKKINLSQLKIKCPATVKYNKGNAVYPTVKLVCEDVVISQKTGDKFNYEITYYILSKDGATYTKVDAPTIVGTYKVEVRTYKPNIEPDENDNYIISKIFYVK